MMESSVCRVLNLKFPKECSIPRTLLVETEAQGSSRKERSPSAACVERSGCSRAAIGQVYGRALYMAPSILKMLNMIMQSAPAWNKTEPHRLSVFCISQPQTSANGKSCTKNRIAFTT